MFKEYASYSFLLCVCNTKRMFLSLYSFNSVSSVCGNGCFSVPVCVVWLVDATDGGTVPPDESAASCLCIQPIKRFLLFMAH